VRQTKLASQLSGQLLGARKNVDWLIDWLSTFRGRDPCLAHAQCRRKLRSVVQAERGNIPLRQRAVDILCDVISEVPRWRHAQKFPNDVIAVRSRGINKRTSHGRWRDGCGGMTSAHDSVTKNSPWRHLGIPGWRHGNCCGFPRPSTKVRARSTSRIFRLTNRNATWSSARGHSTANRWNCRFFIYFIFVSFYFLLLWMSYHSSRKRVKQCKKT